MPPTEPPTADPAEESQSPLTVAPALELMERAQVDIMIATAKRYPRPELHRIRQRMLSYATVDEETAESCMYTLKRKDSETGQVKLIQGPSIRLAEILAVTWQNMWAGSRTIDNDGRKVTAQGLCFDLENNVRMFSEVSRRISHRDGRPYSEDMQIVTAQAANSIARRNAIFMVVPFALIKPVYTDIVKVVTGNASTLETKRDKIFARFYAMGVTKERILKVLGKESADSVDLDDLGLLIGLGTAVKDKEMTIEEAFAVEGRDAEKDETPLASDWARTRIREKIERKRAEKAETRKEEKP